MYFVILDFRKETFGTSDLFCQLAQTQFPIKSGMLQPATNYNFLILSGIFHKLYNDYIWLGQMRSITAFVCAYAK